MRKKKIIISIVVVICVLVGSFFIVRFGVVGRIYNAINKLVVENKAESEEKEGQEEVRYVTEHDKDGNEYVVEMKKTIVFDEEGNEVEIWGDTAVPIRIHDNYYKGEIEKIEDNKIYFIVDKKEKEETKFVYEDVEDYQVVFDINTYNFESDPGLRYYCDSLEFSNGDFWNGVEDFYSASELEFLLGKYLRVQDTIFEDYYTGDRYKALIFYLK